MRITRIKISNFRSIIKIDIKIKDINNFVCFCGANNVGKTNILNALSLFFGQTSYVAEKDCPNHKYYGTRGGSYQPRIDLEIKDKDGVIYKITKNWNKTIDEKDGKLYKIIGTKNNVKMQEKELELFMKKINFFFLPSINLSFPDTIKYIMNSDIIDLETGNFRMSGKKGEMKEALEKYLGNLKSILDLWGNNISPLLEKYREGWGVTFDLPTEVNTFRDLMIGEIDFYIQDKSNSKFIDAKGAGLQRLCHILMYFRIVEKLNDKSQKVILCIDEPDVYLHSGLQKKLLEDIKLKSKDNQLLITTHSPIFIDTIKLSNVFLLDQKYEKKEYQRSGTKKFNAIETHLVDFNDDNGISVLKEYLGIEDKDNLLFDKYNILVEGEEDKIYISKLMQHFEIPVPNIIACNGADNIIKYLEFYEGISLEDTKSHFLVILDNDQKGRTVYRNLKPDRFSNIILSKEFIISYSGFNPTLDNNGNATCNIEIEDFIDPNIICHLANKILNKRGLSLFKKRDITYVCNNIVKPAFQNKGILSLLEAKKNELNPDNGHNVCIDGNNDGKNGFKSGIANIFNGLDNRIISLIGNRDDERNKDIVKFLERISKSNDK